MEYRTKEIDFPGRLMLLGFGAVGQGVLPLLLRHIDLPADRITVVTADTGGASVAAEYGVLFHVEPLNPDNYRDVLGRHLGRGDFLLNLSVDVSSADLIAWCREQGVLYLDTGLESWPGMDRNPALPATARTIHAQREAVLAQARGDGPTALITHGANPGLVSHLLKEALLTLAKDAGTPAEPPTPRDWAALAERLGIRTIHIAEHDTQQAATGKCPGEFVNTWSIAGLVGEGMQPAELGWGSHELHFPDDGRRHACEGSAAIWLDRPGMSTRVRTWTPLGGPLHGYLITHAESITLADYLTLPGATPDTPAYRPTVHYAYHPCADALLSLHELAGREWAMQTRARILKDEIVSGYDELGVLLMGHERGTYWYGSRLDIATARQLAPHNNATSLQVAAAVLAGVIWAMENPEAGVVEPEALDHRRAMRLMRPYLGELVGVYSDWTPLAGRNGLFGEKIDPNDPWQFINFRVS